MPASWATISYVVSAWLPSLPSSITEPAPPAILISPIAVPSASTVNSKPPLPFRLSVPTPSSFWLLMSNVRERHWPGPNAACRGHPDAWAAARPIIPTTITPPTTARSECRVRLRCISLSTSPALRWSIRLRTDEPYVYVWVRSRGFHTSAVWHSSRPPRVVSRCGGSPVLRGRRGDRRSRPRTSSARCPPAPSRGSTSPSGPTPGRPHSRTAPGSCIHSGSTSRKIDSSRRSRRLVSVANVSATSGSPASALSAASIVTVSCSKRPATSTRRADRVPR